MPSNIVYVGVKGHVAAIDKNDGRTLWQTKLKGASVNGHRFVTLLVEKKRIYAHTYGELFCLEADTGRILWQNPLDGLSYDVATIATEGGSSSMLPATEYQRQMQAAAGAAASGGGAD